MTIRPPLLTVLYRTLQYVSSQPVDEPFGPQPRRHEKLTLPKFMWALDRWHYGFADTWYKVSTVWVCGSQESYEVSFRIRFYVLQHTHSRWIAFQSSMTICIPVASGSRFFDYQALEKLSRIPMWETDTPAKFVILFYDCIVTVINIIVRTSCVSLVRYDTFSNRFPS